VFLAPYRPSSVDIFKNGWLCIDADMPFFPNPAVHTSNDYDYLVLHQLPADPYGDDPDGINLNPLDVAFCSGIVVFDPALQYYPDGGLGPFPPIYFPTGPIWASSSSDQDLYAQFTASVSSVQYKVGFSTDAQYVLASVDKVEPIEVHCQGEFGITRSRIWVGCRVAIGGSPDAVHINRIVYQGTIFGKSINDALLQQLMLQSQSSFGSYFSKLILLFSVYIGCLTATAKIITDILIHSL
jgi:hypothetical protein